jgi:integrase
MKKVQNPVAVNGTVQNRKHLTEGELDKLIDAAAGNRWSDRDQTMLKFCYRHGLRVSELVALRWSDIDWTGANIVIMRKKQRTASGTRAKPHPLDKGEIQSLRRLHKDYGADSDYVFATERRGADGRFEAMTTSGFSKLLRRLEAKAGIHNFGPHALRHGRAQSLADAGHDAFLIRDALGHANVSTSNAYVAASPRRLRGVL